MSSDGLSTSLSQRIADSLKIIGKALEDYEYVVTPLPTKLTESSTELALSFNGGKDSVVLLHLVRLALEQKKDDHTLNDVLSIYFRLQESFKEVDEFMDEIAEKYVLVQPSRKRPVLGVTPRCQSLNLAGGS
jgi:3'-phosphoadenosine 5'-phosphosulfate sulfotransferase (PAPS reductase)/FAD synthetase